jgi:hypothetical protein
MTRAPMASLNLDDNSTRLSVDVPHLHPELVEMVRLGYTIDSFYGDEGQWTKGGLHIVARDGYFWRNARLSYSKRP